MKRFANFNWPLAGFTAACLTAILGGSYVALMPTGGLWLRIPLLACALFNAGLLASTLTRLRYTFSRYPMWREIIDNVNREMDKNGVTGGKVEIMLRVTGDRQPEHGDTGTWVN